MNFHLLIKHIETWMRTCQSRIHQTLDVGKNSLSSDTNNSVGVIFFDLPLPFRDPPALWFGFAFGGIRSSDRTMSSRHLLYFGVITLRWLNHLGLVEWRLCHNPNNFSLWSDIFRYDFWYFRYRCFFVTIFLYFRCKHVFRYDLLSPCCLFFSVSTRTK